jgi:hypothetical protein
VFGVSQGLSVAIFVSTSWFFGQFRGDFLYRASSVFFQSLGMRTDGNVMVKRRIIVLAAAMAVMGAPLCIELPMAQVDGPPTEIIDIWADAFGSEHISRCRVVGNVVLWVSRPVSIVDEMDRSLGLIEAGLAQFGHGSRLEACVPDAVALDLSDRFANFLIADNRSLRTGTFNRGQAAAFASLLAQNFYRLVETDERRRIPLVDGIAMRAMGSVNYRFSIVLVRDANSSSMDAVIQRETVGTKFAPYLGEADRRLSTLKWSSVP